MDAKVGRGAKGRRQASISFAEEDVKDDVSQAFKNKMMAHDIHRVRELSVLLEERRRFFDGQLGEVYRNAGVSSPNASLPRLRTDSPPASASVSESNMTSLLGSNATTVGSMDLQSMCSSRSYSLFADDECSMADPYEFSETKDRLGRNWSSSTLLGAAAAEKMHLASKTSKLGNLPLKDSIHNEVMRAAELEKKLQSRRSSLPAALESSLKKKALKKQVTVTKVPSKVLKADKRDMKGVRSSLALATSCYSDTSDDESRAPPRFHPDGSEPKDGKNAFSMANTLSRTRKYDINIDIKRTLDLHNLSLPRKSVGRLPSVDGWNTDIGVMAPSSRIKSKSSPRRSVGSTSTSSEVRPFGDYSPRNSVSTRSGSHPRIAFSSLEKTFRGEGDKSRYQLHASNIALKSPHKFDMFSETSHPEHDYTHDCRYLSLLDALVPVFEPETVWKAERGQKAEKQFVSQSNAHRL